MVARGSENLVMMSERLSEASPGFHPDRVHAITAFFSALERATRGRHLYGQGSEISARMLEAAVVTSEVALSGGPVRLDLRALGPALQQVSLITNGQVPRYYYELFSEGVRALIFLPGLTTAEISQLVGVFAADITARPVERASLIWGSHLPHVRALVDHSFALGGVIDAVMPAPTPAALSVSRGVDAASARPPPRGGGGGGGGGGARPRRRAPPAPPRGGWSARRPRPAGWRTAAPTRRTCSSRSPPTCGARSGRTIWSAACTRSSAGSTGRRPRRIPSARGSRRC